MAKMKAQGKKTKNLTARIGNIKGGSRAYYIVQKIKGQFKMEEIWTGGGGNYDDDGNEGIDCLPMCQQQLQLMSIGDDEALNFAWAEEELRL